MTIRSDQIKIEASIGGRKRIFDDLVRSSIKLINFSESNPSSTAVRELEDSLSEIKESHKVIRGKYLEILDTDPMNSDNVKSVESQREALYTEYEEISLKIMGAIASITKPTEAPIRDQPLEAKVNNTLKPPILTQENTPAELRAWIEQFRAFFNSSRLETVPVLEQQVYLKICLAPELLLLISSKINPSTTIFGTNGCVQILQEEFFIIYQLFKRRMEFFQMTQNANEEFSNYAAKLQKVGDEADLERLSVNYLYVYKYICTATDDDLLNKFLAVKKTTRVKLVNVAVHHETSQSTKKSLGSESVAYKTFTKPKSTQGYTQASKCFRCGRSNHKAHECPMKTATSQRSACLKRRAKRPNIPNAATDYVASQTRIPCDPQ